MDSAFRGFEFPLDNVFRLGEIDGLLMEDFPVFGEAQAAQGFGRLLLAEPDFNRETVV